MKCKDVRSCWGIYRDSESDCGTDGQINDHLARCVSCRQWYDTQNRLEQRLEQTLRKPLTDEDEVVWSSIRRDVYDQSPESTGSVAFWPSRSSIPLACATCLLLVLCIFLASSVPLVAGPSLSQLSATVHENVASGSLETAFQSTSDREVEEYFETRAPFPVRCPPRRDCGFAVRGAGFCKLADQPTAFVTGQVDQTPVSLIVLSRKSLLAFPHQAAALVGERVHECQEGEHAMVLATFDQNIVLVIGETDFAALHRVLDAYGSYPH